VVEEVAPAEVDVEEMTPMVVIGEGRSKVTGINGLTSTMVSVKKSGVVMAVEVMGTREEEEKSTATALAAVAFFKVTGRWRGWRRWSGGHTLGSI
jgi:hypothetical protein